MMTAVTTEHLVTGMQNLPFSLATLGKYTASRQQ
jgi:hypothetical protein